MSTTSWPLFLVAAGAGAVGRYLVDGWVHQRTHAPGRIPWGTFVVNVTGSLGLGVLTGLGLYHDLGGSARVVLGTGGIGAYTTFSTFSWEVVRLFEEGRSATSARYVAATVLTGLAAAGVGLAVTAAV